MEGVHFCLFLFFIFSYLHPNNNGRAKRFKPLQLKFFNMYPFHTNRSSARSNKLDCKEKQCYFHFILQINMSKRNVEKLKRKIAGYSFGWIVNGVVKLVGGLW